jgi:diguanylate cyclase (GGDEF)-like protein
MPSPHPAHQPLSVWTRWLLLGAMGLGLSAVNPATAAAAAARSATNPAPVAAAPTLADTVLGLVQVGYDMPDKALRELQTLSANRPDPSNAAAAAARRRWVLLGQGLVLAGSGRSTDTWLVASALRSLASDNDPAGAAANLTARDTVSGKDSAKDGYKHSAKDRQAAALQARLAQADAHLVLAVLADTQGQTQQGTAAAQSAVDLYRQACPGVSLVTATPNGEPLGCDHRSTWRALLLLARHASVQGQLSAARDHAAAAVELARAAGDAGAQARGLALVADLSASLGENDLAQRQFAQARRLARLLGSADTKTRLAIFETRMRSRSGDLAGARRAAAAGLLQAEQAGSARLRAALLTNLSDIHVKAGRPQAALAAIEQALPTVRRHGEVRIERVLLANAGLARIALGQRAAARQTLEELLAGFAAAGASADRATVLREFADALAAAGDLPGALELYHQERQLAAELTAANRQAAAAELQARYDSSAQQRRLEQLARDNRLIDTQLANRQSLQRLWALGAVVLMLAGVLLALMYRRVRQVNRQLASSHATLQVQSQRDPLTGLANRRCLHERAAGAAAVQGALLLVDIDHFKRINDSQGHASGDGVLVEVARRLAAAVRPEDLVVRWGGEEFLIYAPRLDAAATRALASRVLQAVGGEPVTLPGLAGGDAPAGINVTASSGFACFPLATQGLPLLSPMHSPLLPLSPPLRPTRLSTLPLPMDRAINLVDMALYTAKNQGRNRAVGIARVQAEDDDALRSVEADFDSAWRDGRLALDMLPGPAAADGMAAPVAPVAPVAMVAGVTVAEAQTTPSA